jgi:hypothetical protein
LQQRISLTHQDLRNSAQKTVAIQIGVSQDSPLKSWIAGLPYEVVIE